MKTNKFLLFIIWLFAICILTLLSFHSQVKVDKFMGLTDSTEHYINFPYSVEIQKINVLNAQEVKEGDVLMELVRSELVNEINISDSKIAELNRKIRLKESEIDRELNSLNLKERFEIEKLNLSISELKTEIRINQNLLKNIVNIESAFGESKSKIRALEQERESIKELYKLNRSNTKESFKFELEGYKRELLDLTNYTEQLKNSQSNLKILSPISGEIASISYGEGIQVKAFENIISLRSKYPEFVIGYIHENIVNELKIGQKLSINDESNTQERIYGEVVSIENKLEDIPIKIKKYKEVPLWGYKVFISISKSNFKLGEKVIITTLEEKNRIESLIGEILHFLKLD